MKVSAKKYSSRKKVSPKYTSLKKRASAKKLRGSAPNSKSLIYHF